MTHHVKPGDQIQGPFWDGVVQVVSLQPRADHDEVTVHIPHKRQARTYILTDDDWSHVQRVVQADRRQTSFTGDPARFRLGIEAHRLRLAHSIDPYAALNASRIDPLPHQFEAVYEHLLARPVVKALLAHDAGAGKTIMAGMVIKELRRRQAVQRVLIVAPAGLTIQWQRELLTKFGEDFAIVDRDAIQARHSDALHIWRETDHAITSLAFARQATLRQALASVEWDLVIVDEAHKMAAYVRPNGATRKTQAYKLGEVLSRHTTHFLLMTATPHKGDPDNYRLLVSLLGEQWGDAAAYTDGANPMVLRRTKEEMRKPDGTPLYPRRNVTPRYYHISHEEGDLLEGVHKFIRRHYGRAKSTNRQSAAFALLTLERRMASSPYALQQSLTRIRAKLAERLEGGMTERLPAGEEHWAEWEDLSEGERWARETQAETEAAVVVRRKEIQAELRRVDDLIARTAALVRQGDQEKLQSLREACAFWVGENGEPLIVFTEFKDTLDDLVGRLEAWGYTTTQIHGDMGLKERRAAERTFWDGAAQVLVATEAAGEGINLQCCSVMVNYDIPWNPCRLEQRMGRIHRYGQRAPEVHIFNLIARNTMEGQVKDALLAKMDQMRADLGDKVFDVVGQVLWADDDLRDILERVALGESGAVDQALQAIERGGERALAAHAAEARGACAVEPLDVAAFRRKQATFAAHRLSPETAEAFFRQALPRAGGTLEPFPVETDAGQTRTAFDVVVPADLGAGRWHKLRLSFWPDACSDDETKEDAVLFIAPGHWLFEALLDWVIETYAPDLDRGSVFCDLQPASDRPYLIWFTQGQIRDGLDRRAGDLLAAVEHRADQEAVTPRPSERLDAFEAGQAGADDVRQVQPMLAAQDEVLDQCVRRCFLPALAEQREGKRAALARDRHFLTQGLNGLAEQLNEASVDAFLAEDATAAERLADQSHAAQQRLRALQAEMDRAGHLLMTAPQVLGVALVLPAPLEVEVETAEGVTRVPMRRDDAVEQAAMDIVMDYERRQGRFPQDVHVGSSWDIESYDAQGQLARAIEVKGRGPADADVVSLTDPEWAAAQRLGEQHWLYIVRLGDGMMVMVQDPFTKLVPKEVKRWFIRFEEAAKQGISVSLSQ